MAWSAPINYDKYLKELENPSYPDWEKVEALNTNDTAYVIHDKANDVYALQSYSTVCSIEVDGRAKDLGKWSRTTSKHQGQFRSWCGSH